MEYKHANLCRADVMRALHQYPTLPADLQNFTHNDGREAQLLALDGTLPVLIRGVTYNIPVCVWLQENHPYVPPLVYVKPTNTMAIKPSQFVDSNGKVYHPFLHEWTYPKSDLAALLQILCSIFAQQSPVYAKSAPTPPQPSSYNMPQQPSYLPQYGGYSPNPGAMPPYPVGASTGMPMPQPGPVPGKFTPVVMIKMLFTYFIFRSSPGRPSGGRPPYPPYPPGGGSNMGPSNPPYHVPNHASYPPSTQPSYSGPAASIPHVTQANLDTTNSTTAVSSTLKDEEIKLSLRSAVEDKIRRSTKALFQQAQIELDELNRTQNELKRGSEKLQDILQKLEREQHVRTLSRKQFMLRALLYKARKTAGLTEVAG
ncbi:hypothetical protein pdam_00013890 [Pocillopora damicornis]|uniref:UEV domain-containing protein n=1 Tax=Pocillopora damicornis TaxID=46731 RepID=A0A3M6ULB7_POCDA|nr:hypothetical protein pdam_00013890 [Pocillopora damicornis]